jgi:CsoR family transcriptional regulator, copper-sensing transcriptional repressor
MINAERDNQKTQDTTKQKSILTRDASIVNDMTRKRLTTKKKKTAQPECDGHCHETESTHPDHSPILPKLNRAEGQMRGIQQMIKGRRYCVDILTQLRAVSSAIRSIEMDIFETHAKSCIQNAMLSNDKKEAETKIRELVELLKKR